MDTLPTAYGEQGDLESAIQAFDQAIQLAPDFAEAYSNRGRAYYLQGDLESAIREAIRLDEEDRLPRK